MRKKKIQEEPITAHVLGGTFQFIGIEDTGTASGACCPHCGAEGRYIYKFKIDGVPRGAMAGCYKALTGRLEKGDDVRVYELMAEKQARNKPLNGWEKSLLRLESFRGKYPDEWIDQKIRETLQHRKAFLSKKGHRY